jgi:hypothetical protein
MTAAKGYSFKFQLVEIDMEVDGIVIPRLVKSVTCTPAAPIPLTEYLTPFKESLGSNDGRVLSQLCRDTKDFDLMR